MSDERPILIVDSMNLFVRSYSAYPTMTTNGEQIGGTIGFLKTLRRIVEESQPKAIVVAWEGGGSSKRRALFSEYKLNRKPEKMNRFYEDDIPDSDENRQQQIITLLGLLKCVPVCQIYVGDCEGDDVIAYLVRGPYRDVNKIIVSSDKDFYQLLDDKTKIYSLHKKIFVNAADVLEEFRVTSTNFALAKALCGDPSDNIPGIKGLGFKKVAKLFPTLGTKSGNILQDIFSYASAHVDESAIYKRVLENQDDVKRNWKLVYLDGGMLSATQAQHVDHVLNTFKPLSRRMDFMRKLIELGVNDFNIETFFYTFYCVDNVENK
jgi:DNA polymerase-1